MTKPHLDRKYNGLKLKTWLSIIIILLVLSILEVPIVTLTKSGEIVKKSLGIQKAWAAKKPEWKMPKLAEQSERERNIQLIHTIFGKDGEDAEKVFTCESGLRSNAMNEHNFDGFPDVGVAQLHITDQSQFTVEEMKNPVANLYRAKAMFDDRGWQPWDSSRQCWN